MKKKSIGEIKHGSKVFALLSEARTFNDVERSTGFDKTTVQKVLASLQKNGYISKDAKGMWLALGDIDGSENPTS